MMNTFNLDLDLSKAGTPQVVIMRQADHLGTTIVATLYDHGEAFTQAGLTAEMVMTLPDKKHYYRNSATYSAGTVTHVVDEVYACSAHGRTEDAYFELKDSSGKVYSTQPFTVIVLRSGTEGMTEGKDYDDEIIATIRAWLVEHPEATTTVQDDSLTTPKYKDGSVTTAKMADGSVTADKLASGLFTVVTDAEIAAMLE